MLKPTEPYLTPKRIMKDPGIILLIVLLAICAVVFIWWPTDIYVGGISMVAWLMMVAVPIWIVLTGIYVIWMERRDRDYRDDSAS